MSYTYLIYWSRCLIIWALEPIIWKFKELMGWNLQMWLIWTTKQKVCLSLYKRTKPYTNQAKKVYQIGPYVNFRLYLRKTLSVTLTYPYLIFFLILVNFRAFAIHPNMNLFTGSLDIEIYVSTDIFNFHLSPLLLPPPPFFYCFWCIKNIVSNTNLSKHI